MEGKDFNKELIRRYRDNKATEKELEVFFHLMNEGALEKELEDVMSEESFKEKDKGLFVPMYRRPWFRVAAAAILILTAGGTFFLLNRTTKQQQVTSQQPPVPDIDIAPGGNKAVLTLADNSTIILDNAANGDLAQQGNTKVLKLNDGQLVYNTDGKQTEILYNTLSTPRGGQYKLVLPDGSKVWLNAASSIHFPNVFIDKERKVEIAGEAYFEVAKKASQPFRVLVNSPSGNGGMEVEVLGTHFNINSYNDEAAIKTTLLEGKVKVTLRQVQGNKIQMLSPGQQSQANNNGEIKLIREVDLEEVVAWKNGKFNFTGNDIQSVMRQLGKWYDIEVEYKGDLTKEEFVGIISRNVNISQILNMLKKTRTVNFEIKGRKVIVK